MSRGWTSQNPVGFSRGFPRTPEQVEKVMKKKRKDLKISVKNCRRGKRNNAKHLSSSLRFLGVNAAGLG